MSFQDLKARFLLSLYGQFVEQPDKLTAWRVRAAPVGNALELLDLAREIGGDVERMAVERIEAFLAARKKIRLRAHPPKDVRKARTSRPPAETSSPPEERKEPRPDPVPTDYAGLEASVRSMGSRARAAGRPKSANPFPTDAAAHAWWSEGWAAPVDRTPKQ